MSDVAMPRLSDSMEEGTILKWLKSDGDEVSKGEELVEIETDKANMTYEADEAGTLEIVAKEGDTLAVGETIAQIGEGGGGEDSGEDDQEESEEERGAAAGRGARGRGRRGRGAEAKGESERTRSPKTRTSPTRTSETEDEDRRARTSPRRRRSPSRRRSPTAASA